MELRKEVVINRQRCADCHMSASGVPSRVDMMTTLEKLCDGVQEVRSAPEDNMKQCSSLFEVMRTTTEGNETTGPGSGARLEALKRRIVD